MQAYFCEALAIGDRAALARVATEFGINENDALAMLESDAYCDAVRADEARAAKLGIAGAPHFLIDDKLGISGAQSVEEFLEALQKAWAERNIA